MSEHDQQVKVFNVLRLNEAALPEIAFIYAIPNGGARHPAVAGKLKAEGVKKGVCDICIPIPNAAYHGAYLEMKYGKNKPTNEQKEFMAFVERRGYKVGLAYSAEEALDFIANYLQVNLRGRR